MAMAVEVYPVVHINDREQAAEQAGQVLEIGADGIYLIDHHSPTSELLLDTYRVVKRDSPTAFVGVNFLCCQTALESFHELLTSELLSLPDGLWVDNAADRAAETLQLRDRHPILQPIQYLGGIAFKYTGYFTDDPAAAAQEARRLAPFVDVVTTSGAGTGKPANPAKIAAMKEAIGDQTLALASGVDADNIGSYQDADQVLVSTSIETYPQSGIFDLTELRRLLDQAYDF